MKDIESLGTPLRSCAETVYDQFKSAWDSGKQPSIEDFIQQVPEEAQRALLHDLIRLDLSYRFSAGLAPCREEYERFSSMLEEELLRAALAEAALQAPTQTSTDGPGGTAHLVGAKPVWSDIYREHPPSLPGYEIAEEIGRGGMGIVYRAKDTRLGRNVALKFLPQEYAEDQQRLQRFQREARTASSLNHPNIYVIHDIVESPDRPCLVMEWIEGRTLRKMTGLTAVEVARIGEQVAAALASAHAAGIVHRDIKPENIMLRPDGYVKVLDFGVAHLLANTSVQRSADTGDSTEPGMMVGTTRYMAPEQARGETVSAASDIFSLGIVLYELATGRHPFQSESSVQVLNAILTQRPLAPREFNPLLPIAWDALVLHMLAKDASLRPSALEVAKALQALSGQQHARPAGRAPVLTQRRGVGRRKELEQLASAADQAAEEAGLFVAIAGEPGIGKTTLIEDFVTQLSAQGRAFALGRGRCSERLAGTEAYLPWLEALDSMFRGEHGDWVARVMKVVAPVWYMQVASLGTDDPSYARLLAEARAPSQERAKRELVAFLKELSLSRPLLVILEDVHWADPSTVDLLAYVGANSRSLRLLMLLSYRPSDLMRSRHPFLPIKLELQGRGICREICVEFLSCADVDALLNLMFPNHEFPPAFGRAIHARTEGNPLFMVELLHYLRDRQVIAQEEARWTLKRGLDDIERELPESVRSMIQKKIENLDELERQLLTAASVQGNEFDTAVVAKVLKLDAIEVEDRLQKLERVHELVRAIGEHEFPGGTLSLSYRFVHVLYQNALYAALGPARRQSLSLAVASSLFEFHGNKAATVASELAFLFEAGRDFERAVKFFLAAARKALQLFAAKEAETLASRGLTCLRKLPPAPERDWAELQLQTTRGAALVELLGYSASETGVVYARARELCQQFAGTPEVFPVYIGLFLFHFVRSDLATAREIADLLVQNAQDPPQRARGLMAHSATLLFLGQFSSAIDYFQQCMALLNSDAVPGNDALLVHDIRVTSRSFAALTLWFLGYPDQALTHCHEMVARARQVSHPQNICLALFFSGLVHLLRRDWPQVRQHAEATLALASEHGLPQYIGFGSLLQGAAFFAGAELNPAVRYLRQGLNDLKNIGSEIFASQFRGLLGYALGQLGRTSEALALFDEAIAGGRSQERYYEAELYRLKGQVLAMAIPGYSGLDGFDDSMVGGNDPALAEARDWLRRALDVARLQQAKSLELRALLSLNRISGTQERDTVIRPALAETYSWFEEGLNTPDLEEAKAILNRPVR
jgi:predicted ATPase